MADGEHARPVARRSRPRRRPARTRGPSPSRSPPPRPRAAGRSRPRGARSARRSATSSLSPVRQRGGQARLDARPLPSPSTSKVPWLHRAEHLPVERHRLGHVGRELRVETGPAAPPTWPAARADSTPTGPGPIGSRGSGSSSPNSSGSGDAGGGRGVSNSALLAAQRRPHLTHEYRIAPAPPSARRCLADLAD